jgi:hypothetical protein
MPMPRRSPADAGVVERLLGDARVTSQISVASCSTQPGTGEVLRELRVAAPGGPAVLVEDEAHVPVVP